MPRCCGICESAGALMGITVGVLQQMNIRAEAEVVEQNLLELAPPGTRAWHLSGGEVIGANRD